MCVYVCVCASEYVYAVSGCVDVYKGVSACLWVCLCVCVCVLRSNIVTYRRPAVDQLILQSTLEWDVACSFCKTTMNKGSSIFTTMSNIIFTF